MGAFDPGYRPPITTGAEEQYAQMRQRSKPGKAWEKLRERGVQGIVGDGPGLSSAPVVATGLKSGEPNTLDSDLDEKGLKPHWAWKKKPKVVPFKPNAIDGNSDGMVQDGTIHERPGSGKKPTNLPKPTPKPVERKKVDWKRPLLGELMLSKPRETGKKLKGEDGRYVKERRKFHGRVVNWYLKKAGESRPEGERTIFFMGGGPASLKSTLLASGKTGIPDDVLKIDSDEIKEFIPEYREWVETGVSEAAHLTQDEAKHMTQLVTHTLLNEGKSITLDTTGDGSYKGFKERLEAMKANGHRVVAHYTTNEIDLALKLNEERFKATGRKVPESDVRYIHEQVSRNIPQALKEKLFDELYLYDTNDLDNGPKLILSSKDGKTKIYDPVAYQKFLKKGEPPPAPPKQPKGQNQPGWQPKLGFSDSKPKTPKNIDASIGPFDTPPVNPNLPSPYGNPNKKKPSGPTNASGKPIPPPPGWSSTAKYGDAP